MASHDVRSGLCATGDPLEVGFSWPRGDVRLTFDPAPESSPERRRDLCERCVETALGEAQRASLAEVRAWGSRLRWGGWVGLRFRGGNLRRKLYVEVPLGAECAEWERRWAGSRPVLRDYRPRPVMVGWEEGGVGIEIYQKLDALCPRGLRLLLQRFGFAAREVELLDALEQLSGRRITRALPSDDLGFSVGFRAPGEPAVFTLYSISEALFGPPAEARDRLLTYGAARRWPMARYAALTAPCADAGVPHHGTAGIVIPLAGPLSLAVGVVFRPWEGRRVA